MIYFILLLVSFCLTYGIRYLGLKKSLVSIPNERSSHTVPIPHGGGIAIAFTWFLGLIYLFIYKEIDTQLFYALMIGFIISIISYLDDLYELEPRTRLIAQAFVSSVGLYMLGGLFRIDLGFFVIENQIVTNVLGFLGIIWFINLYNFLDGIDGYAGMEAFFLAFSGICFFGGTHFGILAVCVLGFLVWNWHKAKIFMGDVGSTLLGYIVAIFSIYYQNEGTSILIWLILFGLFWFDATLTLLRRYKNGEKLSKAHCKHAYQRVVQSGLSHSSVVLLAIIINLILFILGYSAFLNKSLLIVFFGMALVILYGIMKIVDNRKKFV